MQKYFKGKKKVLPDVCEFHLQGWKSEELPTQESVPSLSLATACRTGTQGMNGGVPLWSWFSRQVLCMWENTIPLGGV